MAENKMRIIFFFYRKFNFVTARDFQQLQQNPIRYGPRPYIKPATSASSNEVPVFEMTVFSSN